MIDISSNKLILGLVLSFNISATALGILHPEEIKGVLAVDTAAIAGLYGYLNQIKKDEK
jgi:hypothetical protein